MLKRSHAQIGLVLSESVCAEKTGDDKLIDSLFRFIRLNKAIPAGLASLSDQHAGVQALKSAILVGECNARIFLHPDCDLYLLYLITKKHIPFWQGINIYFYLMTLMQAGGQAVREEDMDVLMRGFAVKVDHLVENGKLTQVGEEYCAKVCSKFIVLGVRLKLEELTDYVLQLPATEQWLYRIPYMVFMFKGDYHSMMTLLLRGNAPYLISHQDNRAEYSYPECWMPSATLAEYFFHILSPAPMQRVPFFGSVGEASLRKMHLAGEHPYPLYSRRVKSNIRSVHGFRCGWIPTLLHDDLHAVWGTLLSITERTLILNRLIPAYEWMAREAVRVGRSELAQAINVAINKLYDFDLVASEFVSCDARLFYYIKMRGIEPMQKNLHRLIDRDAYLLIDMIGLLEGQYAVFPVDKAIWGMVRAELTLLMRAQEMWLPVKGVFTTLSLSDPSLPNLSHDVNLWTYRLFIPQQYTVQYEKIHQKNDPNPPVEMQTQAMQAYNLRQF